MSPPAKNAFKNWEKDAHIEFFDTDGRSFSLDCGLQLFGGGTRLVSAKKSFQVRFRDVYGQGSLFYDMFEGSDVNEFKSLVFRAGQDARHTIIRDEIFPSIAVEESPTLLAQRFRYCLLFINGEFFGIYCIKERLGDDYYASHFNVSTESVEVVKGPVRSSSDIYKLMSFVSKNDMSKAENYAYIESKIDIDSLIDWYIFEGCSKNGDITGNVRYIRSSEGDGKWRFALFDLDFTLRWAVVDFEWVCNDACQHSKLLLGLIKNPEFKDRFLTRFGYLLNNVFTEEKLQERIDLLKSQLDGDIARERKKWHSNLTWEETYKRLGSVLNGYRSSMIKSACKALSLTAAERTKYFAMGIRDDTIQHGVFEMKKSYWIVYLLNNIASGIMLPVLSLALLEKGLTLGDLVIVMGLFSLCVILLEVPSGVLADMLGRKRIFLLACAFNVISSACLLFANSLILFIPMIIFWGAGRAFASGSIDALIIDEYIKLNGEEKMPAVTSRLALMETAGLSAGAWLKETDPAKKRYYYCHCPWARESLSGSPGIPAVSADFCNCSAGFVKKKYEIILGRKLKADVVKSVLKGDDVCEFAIHLPEDIVHG